MSDTLFIYTTPADTNLSLVLDDGRILEAVGPMLANGRTDAHAFAIPTDASRQGAVLTISAQGYLPFSNRGIVSTADDLTFRTFTLDDVHLTAVSSAPPEPETPEEPDLPDDPADIIEAVYHAGEYDLSTKEGCGTFTEDCCIALHENHSEMWGHIMKNPGQNQWNGHAVDAVMLLAGEDCGIYDIIFDTESANAHPQYVWKGPPEPELWYYNNADLVLFARRPMTLAPGEH